MNRELNNTVMCNCNDTGPVTEEYHTAPSDFAASMPQEWRTSTRYEAADTTPEFPSTPPQRIRRGDYRRPQDAPVRPMPRRRNLTGVAIVPRRIDFDAVTDTEDDEEDVGYSTTETVQRISSVTEHSYIPETSTVPGTYRLRRTRPPQHPQVLRQYTPRMTRITPCGKCLRI
ncbi:uncharacterized protein LOC112589633 [Harpegnathos saltator]|uniref:uncharacterized protein LOC112589633 n=1 Tax=Harpegnathos saltator TaxID=610380 RepID=UPI000DBEE327|nr:uncharacterized protein LOC112589633 [Harpegnathos saltator]